MEKYADYYDDEQTEERVQISQTTCYNEDEIAEAIERSKMQLKQSKVPYGYRKLDEQIITTVYKIPENQIIHRSCQNNINEINENIINEKYISNSYYDNKKIHNNNTGKNNYKYGKYETAQERDERNDYYQEERINSNENEYNNKIPFKKSVYTEDYYQKKGSPTRNDNSNFIESENYNINKYHSQRNYNKNEYYDDENERYEKYKKIKGGKIENYFENNMSKDGQYLVSMTLSKKIQEKRIPIFGKGKYKKNYKKKVIEIDENKDGEINYDERIRPVRVAGINYKRKNKSYSHEMEFPSDYQKEEIYDDNF